MYYPAWLYEFHIMIAWEIEVDHESDVVLLDRWWGGRCRRFRLVDIHLEFGVGCKKAELDNMGQPKITRVEAMRTMKTRLTKIDNER